MADAIDPSTTAEFWCGWNAFRVKATCSYTDDLQKQRWAEGFHLAYLEHKLGKVWWKSKSLWAGCVLILIGCALWRFGSGNGSGLVTAGFGGGMTASSVLLMFLRLITREPLMTGGEP